MRPGSEGKAKASWIVSVCRVRGFCTCRDQQALEARSSGAARVQGLQDAAGQVSVLGGLSAHDVPGPRRSWQQEACRTWRSPFNEASVRRSWKTGAGAEDTGRPFGAASESCARGNWRHCREGRHGVQRLCEGSQLPGACGTEAGSALWPRERPAGSLSEVGGLSVVRRAQPGTCGEGRKCL